MIRRTCLSAVVLSCASGVFFAASPAATPVATAAQVPTRAARAAKSKTHNAPPRDPAVERWVDIAGFGEVAVYKPTLASRGLVLFASGDGGWNLGVTDMAHQAVALGFWVAGFNTPRFLKALDSSAQSCSDADGLLAKLGTDIVRQFNLPSDTRTFLVGYSSGATLVYTALAADAGQRFAGGISLGFCPDLLIHKPFCAGHGGLTAHWQTHPPTWVFDKTDMVEVPWRILQGEIDQVCEPKFAPEFAAGLKDAKAVMLPHVGHGFGVPRNWMPQYVQSLKDLGGTTR